MDVDARARIHAALGDPHRLRIVDELRTSDRTFQELAGATAQPGNATAHHLRVLEAVGLITRRVSEGDGRRRYITLREDELDGLMPATPSLPSAILFVCTHNSARSQFAAALWSARTGVATESAGTQPADRVHPTAVRLASEFGVDLAGAAPKGYDAVARSPDLVISVCDRAREAATPFQAASAHWSIADPVLVGTDEAFRSAFAAIAARIDRLAMPS